MQSDRLHHGLEDSNSDLELPRLPYANIDGLLAASRRLDRHRSLSKMSSMADDSSVDDSVSSVGPEGWEDVDKEMTNDDESDYPEESISRVPTPSIEVLQSVAEITSLDTQNTHQPDVEASHDDGDEENEDEDEDEQRKREATANHQPRPEDVLLHWADHPDFQVTFAEDRLKGSNEADVSFPMAKITGHAAQSFIQGTQWLDLDHVSGSAKMRLGSRTLRLSRPLKLLYIGSADLQDEIEAKIGSALVAGQGMASAVSGSRRRNVMPISLDAESPEVELVPSTDASMEIETCISALHIKGEQEIIELQLDSGKLVRSWYDASINSYNIRGYELPDLAIIHIPRQEQEDLALRLRCRQFLNRHRIPTLLISSARSWELPSRPLTVDPATPHLIVQVPGMSISESAVFKRLPIDVDTFLRLNSLQLNRNLACLIPAGDLPRPREKVGFSQTLRTFWQQAMKMITDEGGSTRALLTLIGVVVLLISAQIFSSIANLSSAVSKLPIVTPDRVPAISPTSSAPTALAPTTTGISSMSNPDPTKALSVAVERSLTLVDTAAGAEQSQNFQATPFGDNLIVIQPPKWYTECKKAPKLSFLVSRDGHNLDHEVTVLSDKVYGISIPKENAYGVIDIVVTTKKHRGAIVTEVIQADMGNVWTKLFDWMKAAHDQGGSSAVQEKASKEEITPSSQTTSKMALPDKLIPHFLMQHVSRVFNAPSNLTRTVLEHGSSLKRLAEHSIPKARQGYRDLRKWQQELRHTVRHTVEQLASRTVKTEREYRKTYFREQQKNMLKLWWRLKGGPPSTTEDAKVEKPKRSRW